MLLISLPAAQQRQTVHGETHSAKIARTMEDPLGNAMKMALADQVIRCQQPFRIADQLSHLVEQYGVPHYFGAWGQAGLYLSALGGGRICAPTRRPCHNRQISPSHPKYDTSKRRRQILCLPKEEVCHGNSLKSESTWPSGPCGS